MSQSCENREECWYAKMAPSLKIEPGDLDYIDEVLKGAGEKLSESGHAIRYLDEWRRSSLIQLILILTALKLFGNLVSNGIKVITNYRSMRCRKPDSLFD